MLKICYLIVDIFDQFWRSLTSIIINNPITIAPNVNKLDTQNAVRSHTYFPEHDFVIDLAIPVAKPKYFAEKFHCKHSSC